MRGLEVVELENMRAKDKEFNAMIGFSELRKRGKEKVVLGADVGIVER